VVVKVEMMALMMLDQEDLVVEEDKRQKVVDLVILLQLLHSKVMVVETQ
tara:strand:+ start:557 stop:703 length:147 start_codon:yes stop_codon:yes gene_type:complete